MAGNAAKKALCDGSSILEMGPLLPNTYHNALYRKQKASSKGGRGQRGRGVRGRGSYEGQGMPCALRARSVMSEKKSKDRRQTKWETEVG